MIGGLYMFLSHSCPTACMVMLNTNSSKNTWFKNSSVLSTSSSCWWRKWLHSHKAKFESDGYWVENSIQDPQFEAKGVTGGDTKPLEAKALHKQHYSEYCFSDAYITDNSS